MRDIKLTKQEEDFYLGHKILGFEYEVIEDGKPKKVYDITINDFNGIEVFHIVEDGGIKIGNVRQGINATKRFMDDALRLQETEESYYNNFDIDKYVDIYKDKANIESVMRMIEDKKSKRILLEKVRFLKEANLI
jgi:hypothetical protein